VPSHPFADKKTGAAHACGHHAQLSGLLGAALALKESGIMAYLSGGVAFMAVPAEEINDINYRLSLKKAGKITFLSGKQEFIRIGCFDDIDMAVMIHTGNVNGAGMAESYNGFLVKLSRFTGRASHSASAPEMGINALQAANLALAALNAQGETYLDQDHVRVHSVTEIPSAAVNVITAEVFMETQVRAAEIGAILSAAKKADRALRSGALALGAKVAIQTCPGYMPAVQNKGLTVIYKKNATCFIPEENFYFHPPRASSTDMGDVSQVIPSIHPYLGGAQGKAHSCDYRIKDKYMAYVLPAKVLALCAIDLLWDDASAAKKIMKESKTPLTIQGYLELQKKNFHKAVYNYTEK
jgi:amidohydrolase